MRLKRAMAAIALGLFGLVGIATAAPRDAAGSEACIECHDDEDLPDMSRSAHAVKTDARTPGCITCHGPSPTHVKKPPELPKRPPPDISFAKNGHTPVAERNAACQNCHQKDYKRALWGGSQHERADVPCAACHKVHANHDRILAKKTEAEACFSCHKEQRTQLSKPSHHPVPEGKMTCSDCHNVHGSAGPKLAKRDTINDTCYMCHTEKRGPFVFGHEPVNEDCSICHNSHGSTVQAMLKARAPILCQQCHTPHVAANVGAVGGQRGVFPPAGPGQLAPAISGTSNGKNVVNMWQGRSCMNCHTQVHGTNNPSATNPTPRLFFR